MRTRLQPQITQMNHELTERLEKKLFTMYRTSISDASPVQLNNASACVINEENAELWAECSDKQLSSRYAAYLSMEFLVGRAIVNNLTELGLYEDFEELLSESGRSINEFEEIEDEALGNGGLGRLAACFMESAASLGKPLRGYGIRYKYGIFRQAIENGFQKEYPDDWTRNGNYWSIRRENEAVTVSYADCTVLAVPYDMPIYGCGGKNVGTLRLWQAEGDTQNGCGFDFDAFNRCEHEKASVQSVYAEDISKVLYPCDDLKSGKLLRLRQQYFFSSASLQDIVRNHKAVHSSIDSLRKYVSIQLNDTHPVISIPELIRIYMSEGYTFEKAFTEAKHIFNYTNHTVMPEALEKWDCSLIKELLPEIYPIIVMINERLMNKLFKVGKKNDEIARLKIISDDRIHMANMAVYCSSFTNGVAEIHTQILKDKVLKDWFALYPERFQNKTNGITQRRWFALCNRELSGYATELLGSNEWITNLSKLSELKPYADNHDVIERFISIKTAKKQQLSDYIYKHENIRLDTDMIFDIQIKRLHEYKRQLMNALSILYIYFGIKDGTIKKFPRTAFIFGAKSAPGYARAKGIIKLINEIGRLIESDTEISKLMKVVFVSNYNVSYAEKLVAGADISEQISTAGTEASGTGNMKLMLNGAVTLGTLDGANIEIAEEAGAENNYIFGANADEIDKLMQKYNPRKLIAKKPKIARVLNALIDGTLSDGGTGIFIELYSSLLNGASWHVPDNYYVLGDLEAYTKARLGAYADYSTDRFGFSRKCWLNMCSAGKFSSDRTIEDYCKNIWRI